MASLYLLGNPDHYTSHEFVPVYWKNYVREVLKCWRSEEDLEETFPEKLVLQKSEQGKYVGFSPVHDYIYRPRYLKTKLCMNGSKWLLESKLPSPTKWNLKMNLIYFNINHHLKNFKLQNQMLRNIKLLLKMKVKRKMNLIFILMMNVLKKLM